MRERRDTFGTVIGEVEAVLRAGWASEHWAELRWEAY
jgi:hypothetical protein